MSGYVGKSRSIRSESAISGFEVPISSITKKLIAECLSCSYFSDFEIEILSSCSVSKFKYAATKVGPSSWHHTGALYQKTNHYSIESIAKYIVENTDVFEADYKTHSASRKLSEDQLDERINKRNEKADKVEKTKLFKYQNKYKTLKGFLKSNSDFDSLAEKRRAAIEEKRAYLCDLWKKQHPDSFESKIAKLTNDDFVDKYIK